MAARLLIASVNRDFIRRLRAVSFLLDSSSYIINSSII